MAWSFADAYIAAAARCAPPDNKPLPEELARCRPYLERELDLLKDVRVVVALGGVALRTYLGILRDRGADQEPGGVSVRTQSRLPPWRRDCRC